MYVMFTMESSVCVCMYMQIFKYFDSKIDLIVIHSASW